MKDISNKDRNRIILVFLIMALVSFLSFKISDANRQNTIKSINRSYQKLCDASYMIDECDTSNPIYVGAYYDLKKQIEEHQDIFDEEYDAHVVAEVLLASDIIDRTSYLKDFRCRYNMDYTKAYLDYYEDEFREVKLLYFRKAGSFHPQYIDYNY